MPARPSNLAMTVTGVAVLVSITGLLWFGAGGTSGPVPDHLPVGGPVATVDPRMITVHVSGAVQAPGVIDLPPNARMADAVRAAGGATVSADLGGVNLASELRDGQHVVIPLLVADGVGSPDSDDDRLDINSAGAAQLESLPGVGPVLAARIVSYRDEHGPFDTIEDLLGVPGIGESKLAAIRDVLDGS